MSMVIIPNPDGTFKKFDNVDPNDYRHVPGVLINPYVPPCSEKYWRIVGGQVVEKSVEEKAALDIAEATALAAAQAAWQDAADNSFNLSMLEVVTALIQVINVRIPNNKITKDELVAQIKENRK